MGYVERDRVTDQNSLVLNILNAYADATPTERADGFAWYPEANRAAEQIAIIGDITHEQACALLAVISPMLSWSRNVQVATELAWRHRKGIDHPNFGLPNSLRRAKIVLSGDLSDAERVKGTRKVHNFYKCILGVRDHVCIDRHAARVAYGDASGDGSISSEGEYDRIAGAYRDAARELGKGVRHVQAVTWLVMRRWRGEDS